MRQVYFFNRKTDPPGWHALRWTEADACDGPMNEDGLTFARKLAKSKYRHFDDKLALAELLDRRKLSQGHTMAERRAALRLSRQQSTLGLDIQTAASVPDLPTPGGVRNTPDSPDGIDDDHAFVDVLDEDVPVDDDHIYDDVLEDV